MFYSKLYKKYYPFKSGKDVFYLSEDERGLLLKYIKNYPGRLSNKMLSARRYGVAVEGWDRPKGWKGRVLPSTCLVDVLIEMRNHCNDIIAKVEKSQSLTEGDLANINRILYSNKYCRLLSFFLCPTPNGRVSAVFQGDQRIMPACGGQQNERIL